MAPRCVFLICALFSILPNELHAQGGHAIHPRDTKPHVRKSAMGPLGEALAHNGFQTWQGFKYLIDRSKLRGSQRKRERNLRGLQPSYGVKGRGVNLKNSNVDIQTDINTKQKGVKNQRKLGKKGKRTGVSKSGKKSTKRKQEGGSMSKAKGGGGQPRYDVMNPGRGYDNDDDDDDDDDDEEDEDEDDFGPSCFLDIDLEFFQLPAINDPIGTNPIFIDYNVPNEQALGTAYIYNYPLLNQTTTNMLERSFATGHCSRIQMREIMDNGDFTSGGGYCHFTYTLYDGENTMSFNVAGEVFDFFGGTLAVEGGTLAFQGVTGQIDLTPVDITSDGGFTTSAADFFLAPDGYTADASLHINTCLSSNADTAMQ